MRPMAHITISVEGEPEDLRLLLEAFLLDYLEAHNLMVEHAEELGSEKTVELSQ